MNVHSNLFEQLGVLAQNGAAPLYLQLQDAIRRAIQSGTLQPRDAIPAERELSTKLGISRITVRKAIEGLVEEGLLVRQQGSGTYVAARMEKQFSQLSSFSEDMLARGRSVESRWLARTRGPVTSDEALTFGLSLSAPVYRFSRVRYADGIPMAIEYSTIAGSALTSEDEVSSSLYDALEAHGNRPVRALQRLRAVPLEGEQATHLGVSVGTAALFIERRGYNSRGQLVEVTKSWYRGDAYDFVSEINGL